MNRYLVDTNIFVYARGREHPYREPCRALLRAAGDGLIQLDGSVEVVQEFTHLLVRRGLDREQVLAEAREVRSQYRLHAFDEDVLRTVLTLLANYTELGVRDAVHAATALRAGITQIVSADHVFDAVGEVTRVDPADAAAPWSPRRG